MNETMANDSMRLRITIMLGIETHQTAKLVSVFPHLIVAVELQNPEISVLTTQIIELQLAGGHAIEIQQLVAVREKMICVQCRLACANLGKEIRRRQFRVDTYLTLLFSATKCIYLWSIATGIALDAFLVILLWLSSNYFTEMTCAAKSFSQEE